MEHEFNEITKPLFESGELRSVRNFLIEAAEVADFLGKNQQCPKLGNVRQAKLPLQYECTHKTFQLIDAFSSRKGKIREMKLGRYDRAEINVLLHQREKLGLFFLHGLKYVRVSIEQ